MPKIYQLRKKRKPSKNLIDTLNDMSKDDLKKEVIQLLNQTQSKSQEIQKLKNINLKQKKKIKNYQLAQKKSKIKNSLHETHEEILELYEDEQIKKDPRNKAFSKKWKNKMQNSNTVGSRLISILDKIDETQPKTSRKTLNKKNFSFPFGADINEKQIKEFLKKIVAFINENYTRNVKRALKDYFKSGKIEENIRMITGEKGIVSTLKKDMIISLLLEKNKNELTSLSSPILCKKISEIPLNEIMIKENGDNNYHTNNIDIIQTLIDHINKMKICFGELPEDICGLTLYSGDVIINAKYLNWIYSNDKDINSRKKQALCSIFLTLLHEFCHILVRLVKSTINKKKAKINQFEENEDQSIIRAPNSGMKNYKIKKIANIFTGEKNKIIDEFDILINNYNKITGKKTSPKNQKTDINESGRFFDLYFYGIESYCDLTNEEADFFLNLKNFEKNGIKNYYQKLKNVYNMRDNKSKGIRFKLTNFEPYTISLGKCNFSKRSK